MDNKEKVLLLDIKQPFAHYREPKIMQDDYIPTLNLPPATTIAGMISYLTDRKLKSEYKIAVVGNYENKVTEFTRGEQAEFFSSYETLVKSRQKFINKNKLNHFINLSEFYNYHKKEFSNRIMYFEVLQNVNLKIFISTENNELVREALEKPQKYLSLGRKEDFIFPSVKGNNFVKEVEIERVYIKDKKQAIEKDLALKNTYINVDIKNENQRSIIEQGILYSLPKKYADLNAEKKDRVIEYGHYIYIGDEGAYLPQLDVNVYKYKDDKHGEKNVLFTWM